MNIYFTLLGVKSINNNEMVLIAVVAQLNADDIRLCNEVLAS